MCRWGFQTTGRFMPPPTACITGVAFSAEGLSWPSEYRGKYSSVDFSHGFIKIIAPNHPQKARAYPLGCVGPWSSAPRRTATSECCSTSNSSQALGR
jgi:hypothetical protein